MITHYRILEVGMGLAATEAELADKTRRFIKAELKRADVTYEALAERLKEHGLTETKASIANKLSRGTVGATFFLATLAALGRKGMELADL
jgi:Domain of unknown function (DUF6471)